MRTRRVPAPSVFFWNHNKVPFGWIPFILRAEVATHAVPDNDRRTGLGLYSGKRMVGWSILDEPVRWRSPAWPVDNQKKFPSLAAARLVRADERGLFCL